MSHFHREDQDTRAEALRPVQRDREEEARVVADNPIADKRMTLRHTQIVAVADARVLNLRDFVPVEFWLKQRFDFRRKRSDSFQNRIRWTALAAEVAIVILAVMPCDDRYS